MEHLEHLEPLPSSLSTLDPSIAEFSLPKRLHDQLPIMVVAREEAEEHIQGPKDLTEPPTGFVTKKKASTGCWFYRRGAMCLQFIAVFLVVFFMFFRFPSPQRWENKNTNFGLLKIG